MKTCTQCHIEKPLSDFHKRAVLVGGHRSECKKCRDNYDRVYRRSPAFKQVQRRSKLKHTYGLSEAAYEVMFVGQNRVCALCRLPSTRPLAVDHDHATGKIRALLCLTCNTGLGALRDDPALMRSAATYVEVHRG